MGIFSPSHILE